MLRLPKLKQFERRPIIPINNVSPPVALLLDREDLGDRIIYPGMVATYLDNGLIGISNYDSIPIGLFMNYVNGNYDELDGASEIGIWPLINKQYDVLRETNSQNHSPLDSMIDWDISAGEAICSNALGEITLLRPILRLGYLVGNSKSIYYSNSPIPIGTVIEVGSNFIKIRTELENPYTLGYLGIYHPSFIGHPDYLMGQLDRQGEESFR